MAPDRFRVTLLGTGNPRPLMDRFGPSTLVQVGRKALLFDCGRGATQRLFALDALAAVRDVFLTHLHSDHVVGLADLWLTGWIFARGGALHVRGPAGTRDLVSHLSDAHAFDVRMRRDVDERLSPEGVDLSGEDVSPGVVLDEDGVRVTAIEVDHGPLKPAFGYRIDSDGRSVVLSGDTRRCDALVDAAKAADLLVHEVAAAGERPTRDPDLTRRVLAHHTSPEEAGQVFTEARPRLAVYSHLVLLGGMTPEELIRQTRLRYDGPLEIGEDGMAFDVADGVVVNRPTALGRR